MSIRSPDLKAIEAAEAEHEFIEQQAEKNYAYEILKRHIEWQHYQNEGKLTAKDCTLILGYDQQSAQTQQDYLDESGPALVGLFIKILRTISAIETVEYTIILIDQLFSNEKTPEQLRVATQYFIDYAAANPTVDITAPFLQILTTSGQHNPFTFLRVQHVLATLLAAIYSQSKVDDANRLTVTQFLRYLISKISTLSSSSPVPSNGSSSSSSSSYATPSSPTSTAASNRELMACLGSLKLLLRASPRLQELFAEQDGLRALAALLNKDTQNAQLLYLVGFNIWLCSYHATLAQKLKEFGVIKKLVQVVKVNGMEKVTRIGFAILRNFLDHKNDSFNEDMIGSGLVPVVETLSKRKFKDPDILTDMNRIMEVLYETIKNMSTFEKYGVEVMSGILTWTNPAHKNEIFWRENILAFEQKNFALVQQLIKCAEPHQPLTNTPQAHEQVEITREVACYDLGEFARFHPDGKKVIIKLKGKEVLMKNLQEKSTRISKAALLATQKLMVANWEMLNKSSSGGVASLVSTAKKN